MAMFARNRWAGVVRLKTVVAGKVVPLETGPVTAFLSDSFAPDAEPIDESLVVEATYLGDSDGCHDGDWEIVFPKSVMNEELFEGLDAVYIIIEQPDEERVYADAEYQPSRLAEVVS